MNVNYPTTSKRVAVGDSIIAHGFTSEVTRVFVLEPGHDRPGMYPRNFVVVAVTAAGERQWGTPDRPTKRINGNRITEVRWT